MSSKRLHYSDEKWLDLISECRSSGISDKDWCMEHQIGISTFFLTTAEDLSKSNNFYHPYVAESSAFVYTIVEMVKANDLNI